MPFSSWVQHVLLQRHEAPTTPSNTEAAVTIIDTCWDRGEQFFHYWEWHQQHMPHTALHYVVLADTFPTAQFSEYAQTFPELKSALIAQWPVALEGYHRLLLCHTQLTITLIVGDRQKALSQLIAQADGLIVHQIDSWDAYAMKRLGLLSKHAAWCALDHMSSQQIGWLTQAGFVVSLDQTANCHRNDMYYSAYYARMMTKHGAQDAVTNPCPEKHAIVIGAGLAGTTMCERLTASGWQVDLIEAEQDIAQGASGNVAGVYMPMVSQDDNVSTQLMRSAYVFAQQLWHAVGGVGQAIDGEQCGVLQLARDAEQDSAFEEAAVRWQYPKQYAQYWSPEKVSEHLGASTRGGWFYPQGGWLHPPSVCRAMLAACAQHAGKLNMHLGRQVSNIVRENNQWSVYDDAGQYIVHAPVVIIANGIMAKQWLPESVLPMTPIWGQVTHIPEQVMPALPFVVTGDGYLTRAYQHTICMGATYSHTPLSSVTIKGHQENLDKLAAFLPSYTFANIDQTMLTGRVGIRCVMPDRLPMIGSLPDVTADSKAGQGLHQIKRMPGLYSVLGYASRGLIWSPIAAEIIVSELNNTPMPLPKYLLAAMDPARFSMKNLQQSVVKKKQNKKS